MTIVKRMTGRGVAAAVLLLAAGTTLAEAETVRVTAARGLMRAEPNVKSPVVLTVPAGTVLDVTGKSGEWCRVLAPPDRQGTRVAGYILAGQVAAESPTGRGTAGTRPQKPGAKPQAAAAKKPSRFTFRGFGVVEYERFNASRSFDAVFGRPMGLQLGGGVEMSIGSQYFVQGRAEYARMVGERVFVFEGEVFPLGLTDTVTLIPIDVTAGYRFATRTRLTPYVAGGVGLLRYSEEAESSTEIDSEDFLSLHAAGGVEYPLTKWLAVAGEVQYRAVRKALGSEGVGNEFGESDLGGISVCVKVLFGRQPPRKVLPPKPAAQPPKPVAPKR